MSKSILILGAGRSSSYMIDYILQLSQQYSWKVTVGDFIQAAAQERLKNRSGKAISFDIMDQASSRSVISQVDVVLSLLPAHLHILVARICLDEGKHLINASYVSDEMQELHKEAMDKGILLLNECGLDPGIDHMSAMQVIDRIKLNQGNLYSFESFTGGLIASETDPQNPWKYKFTWNSRNVVMAGQGTAKFLKNGQIKFIPYQQLYKRLTSVSVPEYGEYEGYLNRDSLKYVETYGISGIKTMMRGTLRNKGYCGAWNILVQLGCCEDTYSIEDTSTMTHLEFISLFIDVDNSTEAEAKICAMFQVAPHGEEINRLRWSGLFSSERIGLNKGTPAQLLEYILNKKWKLEKGNKDLIVMWHRFKYEKQGKHREVQAYLTCKGEDEIHTAMSKTVGLPLAIAAKLLLQGKIKSRGVMIPIVSEFYEPILNELATLGIKLTEKECSLQ